MAGKKQQNNLSHIAIIMDGNYRYGKLKFLQEKLGHKKGVENIEKIVDAAIDLNIKFLTLYAFSTENWQRPKDEVDYLMQLLDEYLDKEAQILQKKGVKIKISGEIAPLSAKTQEKINKIEEITKGNDKITLIVAFNYGSRSEIVKATQKIATKILNKSLKIEEIDEKEFAKNLYCNEIPDPDLLIRTGGEMRISNFLLYQIAYCELYFTEKLWPEFSKEDLAEAIANFNQRKRNYGKR